MANVVLDPSFELNTDWQYFGSAQRTDAITPNTGTYSARLVASPFGPVTSILQQSDLVLVPGQTYDLRFYVYDQSASTAPLAVLVDKGAGSFVSLGSVPVLGGPWRLVPHATFVAEGTTGQVMFRTLTGSGTWYLDDVAIRLESELTAEQLVQRGKYTAYSALLNALRGINGGAGGYYHDLSGRVRTTWEVPEDIGDRIYTPYLCLPFDGDTEQIETLEGGVFRTTWTQRIYGYVPESSSTPEESSAVEGVCKLRDDIVRALLADETLTNSVRDSQLGGIETNAGIGLGYGAVVVEMVFNDWFTKDELGPNAI